MTETKDWQSHIPGHENCMREMHPTSRVIIKAMHECPICLINQIDSIAMLLSTRSKVQRSILPLMATDVRNIQKDSPERRATLNFTLEVLKLVEKYADTIGASFQEFVKNYKPEDDDL